MDRSLLTPSQQIAERLAKEADTRQVIVFTHDIAFLISLKKKAGELDGVGFSPTYVYSEQGDPGASVQSLPWHAMPVKDRLTTFAVGYPSSVRSMIRTGEHTTAKPQSFTHTCGKPGKLPLRKTCSTTPLGATARRCRP